MTKGKMIAVGIVIAIAIAVGAAFAASMQSDQNEVEVTETTEGRNIVVNLQEKLGVAENQNP